MASNMLTQEESPWWAKLLDRFGFPTMLAFVLLYFGYVAIGTMWRDGIIPLRDAHLQFIRSVEDNSKRSSDQLYEQTKLLRDIREMHQAVLKDYLHQKEDSK